MEEQEPIFWQKLRNWWEAGGGGPEARAKKKEEREERAKERAIMVKKEIEDEIALLNLQTKKVEAQTSLKRAKLTGRRA